jgi:iron complex transport system substrate-binding protein
MRLYFFLLLVVLISCREKTREVHTTLSLTPATQLKYAAGFTLQKVGEATLIEVLNPYPAAKTAYSYLLVPHGKPVPPLKKETQVIRVPIQRIVCTSTTHIPLLDYLGETDALVGFPTLDYISSEQARKRIDEGKVQELGVDKGMNLERLALLKPDMVMGYTMTADLGQFKKIEQLGIPVVINAEYLEKHPLGRAEWIKFLGLFFNKEQQADSVFTSIEQDYLNTRKLVEGVPNKPTVLSGILYGDTWFLPGGQNYAARLFEDAGCYYLWADDQSYGFLELSFESVYARAHQADLWIGVASFETLRDMAATDNRYTKFRPFTTGRVYTYNARKGAKGGSEFLEIGYLRPDLILKDLVKIAHPNRLPEHTLYFHAPLK